MKSLAWIALSAVVLLSLIPGDVQIRTSFPSAVEHAAAYLVLAGLFALIYQTPRQRLVILLLLVVAAGGLEVIQILHPSRYASIGDFVASVGGALIGVLLAFWVGNLSAKRRSGRKTPIQQRIR